MFESAQNKEFVNRPHVGQYKEIAFDTYVDYKGKEEIDSIESTLHYVEMGEGEPLALLHNVGGSLYSFRKILDDLAEHFRVIAIDLPAHGYSDAPSISYSIEEISLSLESFLNMKNIEQTHICTFGESAAYALDFAIHNKHRVGKMVFISPHIIVDDKSGTIPFPLAAVCGKFRFNNAMLEGVYEEFYFDKTLLTETVMKETFAPFAEKEFRTALKFYAGSYNDLKVREKFYDLKNPMLVIRGDDDRITPPVEEGMASLPSRNMSILTVRNCGYIIPEEKPQKLSRAITEFITAE